jgi:hypothetical protein
MAFTQKVAELIAFRSGYICNNPECNVLTIGPATSDPSLRTKTGEAAHIVGEKVGAARYRDIGAARIKSAENGIWLCVACHTLVDKNKGADYSEGELLEWKRAHEELMSVLLRTHRSPLPLVRRHSANTTIAQDIVDTLALRGAMFQPHSMEDPASVIKSVEQIRRRLQRCLRQIDLDPRLREICSALINACRELMNENSRDTGGLNSYLDVLRARAGVLLYRLQHEYGCTISGPIVAFVRR